MANKNPPLVNSELYHICLRAVGDTEIFNDENDYYRGIFSIYEFNNLNTVEIWRRRRDRKQEKKKEKSAGCPTPNTLPNTLFDGRDKMVEILAFVFMPNHIHLLVRQLKENGISNFMKKVGGGYANYFNKKYQRKGHLFDKFRAIHISSDRQLMNVFVYIHANPVSLIEPGWKERGVKAPVKAIKFLEEYKWSSYKDYIGMQNFTSVTSRDFMSDLLNGSKGCKEAVEGWIRFRKNTEEMEEIVLE